MNRPDVKPELLALFHDLYIEAFVWPFVSTKEAVRLKLLARKRAERIKARRRRSETSLSGR